MVCRVPSPSLIARTFWAVVFVVAIGGGCGGGKAENKAKSDEALAKAREAAKLEEQGEEAAAVKQWGRTHPRRPPPPPPPPRAVAPAGSATASAGRGGKSVRPEEVARWRAEDFRAALRDHDPRLVEAVAYAGRHCATRESGTDGPTPRAAGRRERTAVAAADGRQSGVGQRRRRRVGGQRHDHGAANPGGARHRDASNDRSPGCRHGRPEGIIAGRAAKRRRAGVRHHYFLLPRPAGERRACGDRPGQTAGDGACVGQGVGVGVIAASAGQVYDRARHAVGDIQATVNAAQRGARREPGRSDRPVPQRSIVEPRRTVARASVRGSESPGAAAVAGPRFAGRAPSCFVTPGRWGCGLMPGR